MIINKNDLCKNLGITCVETYFISWLEKLYDLKKLYLENYMTIEEIINEVQKDNNYSNIKKIQEISEEYGITSHDYLNIDSKDALKHLKHSNDLFLIRVNKNYYKDKKIKPTREDHYICLNNELEYIDHYPLFEGKFKMNEFEEIYDNQLLIYRIKNINTQIKRKNEIIIGNEKINKEVTIKELHISILILKIMRKRLKEIYKIKILEEEVEYLDRIFLIIKKKLMKQENINIDDYLKVIKSYEKKVIEEIKNEKETSHR